MRHAIKITAKITVLGCIIGCFTAVAAARADTLKPPAARQQKAAFEKECNNRPCIKFYRLDAHNNLVLDHVQPSDHDDAVLAMTRADMNKAATGPTHPLDKTPMRVANVSAQALAAAMQGSGPVAFENGVPAAPQGASGTPEAISNADQAPRSASAQAAFSTSDLPFTGLKNTRKVQARVVPRACATLRDTLWQQGVDYMLGRTGQPHVREVDLRAACGAATNTIKADLVSQQIMVK